MTSSATIERLDKAVREAVQAARSDSETQLQAALADYYATVKILRERAS